MMATELCEVIRKCPYIPQDDEINFDTSTLVNGRTCVMWWITTHKTLPPKQLLHDPRIVSRWHETCLSLWINEVRSEIIPMELYHSDIIEH